MKRINNSSTGRVLVELSFYIYASNADITNNTASVGYKNPYRYREYRYDTETGLYYLQSRYYNPDWGRFLNADGITRVHGELLSHNMFVYCKNNLINIVHVDGYNPLLIRLVTFLVSWATAVLSSPDLETDIVAINTDIAEGNTAAAAMDTVSAVVPRLPAGGGAITKNITKSVSKAKTGPKAFDTGAHNKKITSVANSITDGDVMAGGQRIVNGKPLREAVFKTPNGLKSYRRPDILVQRFDGSTYGINVGKITKSGAPIKRK